MKSRTALFIALGIDNVGSGLFLPLALLYAARVGGTDVGTAGVVLSAAAAVGLAVPPVASRLGQLYGPRFVVVLSQLLQALGALIYGLAAGTGSVFVAAVLISVGTQLFYSCLAVFVADVAADAATERSFASLGRVRAACFGLGALVGGLALTYGGTDAVRALVLADAATFLVAAVVVRVFVQAPRTAEIDRAPVIGVLTVLRDRSYVILMLVTFMTVLTLDVAAIAMPVFMVDVLDGPAWVSGTAFAIGTAASSMVGVRVVDALRNYRRSSSMQIGAAFYGAWAVATVAMLVMPTWLIVPWALATWLFTVAGTKVVYPMSGALAHDLPSPERRVAYMATNQYVFTLGSVVAPAIVGLFAFSDWLPLGIVIALNLLAILLIPRVRSRWAAADHRPQESLSAH